MFERFRQKRVGAPLGRILVYHVSWLMVRVFYRVVYRMRITGAENVPQTGSLLIVANHQSYLDPPAIGGAIDIRQIDYVARLGLFRASRFLGWLISLYYALPIKEEGGDAGAIKEVLRRLDTGSAVLIFPEGSRSEDGAMQPFKRGVAVLVKRSRCPVLPVAVEGCFDAWPRHRRFPRLFGARIAVAFGSPIGHDELMAHGADAALLRLSAEIDRMRLGQRKALRQASGGRFPPTGVGDRPLASPAG